MNDKFAEIWDTSFKILYPREFKKKKKTSNLHTKKDLSHCIIDANIEIAILFLSLSLSLVFFFFIVILIFFIHFFKTSNKIEIPQRLEKMNMNISNKILSILNTLCNSNIKYFHKMH